VGSLLTEPGVPSETVKTTSPRFNVLGVAGKERVNLVFPNGFLKNSSMLSTPLHDFGELPLK
jgi:hypothetical protein